MDSQETEDIDEINVYKEINQALGVSAVRLRQKPENMYLERYSIDEEQRYAILFYNYNNEIIRYTIYLNDSDSSFAQRELDKKTDEYQIETDGGKIQIEEYVVQEYENKRYIADFKYRDVNYQLIGIMEKEEFDEIIKNLGFL